ncbi:Os06g0238701 [Oryza sativa Japonica Group]|uniref:Os06g0238701 protein n=1 Tax=Oryza sativa subsp. japonica TaxID=39947 RepID=A0A0P0WV21_ORYSJ|nr:Os06g0238701 [Oryza sativa Japonica Group]
MGSDVVDKEQVLYHPCPALEVITTVVSFVLRRYLIIHASHRRSSLAALLFEQVLLHTLPLAVASSSLSKSSSMARAGGRH